VSEIRPVPKFDDRDAIRAALQQAGFLPEGSPSAEFRAQELVDELESIVEARWKHEHRARAAERLALRGQVFQARSELTREQARRAAAEDDIRGLRASLAQARAQKRLAELRLATRLRRGPAREDRADDLERVDRRQQLEIARLQSRVSQLAFVLKTAVVLGVVLATSVSSWFVGQDLGLTPLGVLAIAGAWLAALVCGVLVFAGQRFAVRVITWAFLVLDVIANVLQILSSGGDGQNG
jgi:hypothetical protein